MVMWINNSMVYPMNQEGAILVSTGKGWDTWDVVDGNGDFQCTYFKGTDAIVSENATGFQEESQ